MATITFKSGKKIRNPKLAELLLKKGIAIQSGAAKGRPKKEVEKVPDDKEVIAKNTDELKVVKKGKK